MEVLVRLVTAQAARQARQGRYRAAEALLAEAAAADDGPRADLLDLQARIRAQEGRYPDAAALWRQALSLSPGNRDFQDALDLVALGSPRRAHLAGAAARALLAVVLLLLAWTVIQQRGDLTRLRAELASVPPPPAAVLPSAQPGDALLDTLTAALASSPDMVVTRGDREIEVRFDEGLFSEGIALRPGAPELLARVSELLSPVKARIALEVRGHTDPLSLRVTSPYRSNMALGLARAARVVELLAQGGALLPGSLSVRATAPEDRPFPTETSEGRLRNRTASLRIVPAG
ncbi:MAG: hypothetical protein Q8N53_01550 [Longimicrobiales bacterium]|nr:hypothetical protein [Longimicrobiales bacterium]